MPLDKYIPLTILVSMFCFSGLLAQTNLIQTLTAPGGGMDYEAFGNDVAFTDDWMVVGAVGSLNSSNGDDTGGAYIFRKTSSGDWEYFSKLEESDYGLEGYGWRVAIQGELIAIGAPDADPISKNNGGALYIYRFDGSKWLKMSNFEGDSRSYKLGSSVEVNGNWIFSGMTGSDLSGVEGSGCVKIYKRNGNNIALHQTIFLNNSFEKQGFGVHLAATDSILLVGSYAPSGPFYQESHLYQYILVNGSWEFDAEIDSPNRPVEVDVFGEAFSIEGEDLAVGARLDLQGMSSAAGSVYIFERSQTGWSETQIIRPSEGLQLIEFGKDVCLRGNTLAISANLLARPGVPVFGGVVYLYQRMTDGQWTKIDSVTRRNVGNEQIFNFAPSVWVDGEFAAIGNFTGAIQNKERGKVYWVDYRGSLLTNVQSSGINHTKVSVFPNPVLDGLNLSVENDFFRKIEVLSSNGQSLMLLDGLYSGKAEIPFSELAKGLYFVKVWTNKGVGIEKVIKQ